MANQNQPTPVYSSMTASGKPFTSVWLQWFNWLNNFLLGIVNYANATVNTPVTGFSVTIGSQVTVLLLTPAGTLAAGTVTMPAAPYNGMPIEITSTQTVTSFTLSANAGQSIKNAPTTLLAGTGVAYFYNAPLTTWFRRY